MQSIHDGQCGLCMYFGEHDQLHRDVLVQIQTSHRAPETSSKNVACRRTPAST